MVKLVYPAQMRSENAAVLRERLTRDGESSDIVDRGPKTQPEAMALLDAMTNVSCQDRWWHAAGGLNEALALY